MNNTTYESTYKVIAYGDFSDKKLFEILQRLFSIVGRKVLSHSNYYLPVSDKCNTFIYFKYETNAKLYISCMQFLNI